VRVLSHDNTQYCHCRYVVPFLSICLSCACQMMSSDASTSQDAQASLAKLKKLEEVRGPLLPLKGDMTLS